MAAHGGKVTVWSKEGEGSTFTLRLPALRIAHAPRPGAPPPATQQPAREAVK